MGSLPGERRQAGWYPQRSRAPSFVRNVPKPLPGNARNMRLEALPLECGLPQSEGAGPFALCNDPSETLFN